MTLKGQAIFLLVVGKSAAAEIDTGTQPDSQSTTAGMVATLPPPSFGYSACSATQPIGKLSVDWSWSSMVSAIKAQSLNAANVMMLIDISKTSNFEAQIRFCYNLLTLFKLTGSKFSIMTYGSSATVVATAKTVSSEAEIKAILVGIKAKAEETVNCGQALKTARTSFFAKLVQSMRSVMLLVSRTKSEDDVYKAVEQLKGAQLIISAIGNDSFSLYYNKWIIVQKLWVTVTRK